MDFDEDRIYYSHQNLRQKDAANEGVTDDFNEDGIDLAEGTPDLRAVKRHCREFLSEQSFACMMDLSMKLLLISHNFHFVHSEFELIRKLSPGSKSLRVSRQIVESPSTVCTIRH